MSARRNLRYHLVLVCKYRKPALRSIEEAVLQSVRDSAVGSGFKVEDVAVEDGDHVHILLRTTATFSVDSMVKRIKRKTTWSLWNSHSFHLENFYWGVHHKLWSSGYYVSTIGEASLDTVKKYLEKQR